jgi:hypothetical protein
MIRAVGDNLLTVLILFVLGVFGYVVIVGGILCLLDRGYDFAEYLDDLARLQPILIGAVVGAVGREVAPLLRRRDE